MSDFVIFNKLRRALEYSSTRGREGLFVFSWEINEGGCRRFLVSSKTSFWSRYKNDKEKSCYEVIKCGSVSKLYFDLEYYCDENQDRNGEVMTTTLISRVNECLSSVFCQNNQFEDVLILDSSNSVKFSVHLIFMNICCENNTKIGEFVRFFESNLTEEDKKVFEINHKGKKRSFIDRKVYSNNQNLRLYLSTKYQKLTPLTVASYDKSVPKLRASASSSHDEHYLIFENSLITSIGTSCNMIDMSSISEESVTKQTAVSVTGRRISDPSPYPELDQFVKEQLSPGDYIRSWSQRSSVRNKILFAIGGSRFCSNVNRAHRSNNVYYVCDLSNLTLNQHCHSCIGYEGPDISIPKSVFAWVNEFNEPF